MAEGMELNRIDQTILKYCSSQSPEEIALRLGHVITAAKVAERAKTLLASRSWLTQAEEEELVLRRLHAIFAKLEMDFIDADAVTLQLRALKEIGNRLDKRRAATEVDLNTYHVNVGREMARAYDIALGYMKGALRDSIDAQQWDELATEALVHARSALADKAVDDEGRPVRALDAA